MPTRCNRGFYCRYYCLFNMFQAPLCPSSGAQEYYTVVAACGLSCCKDVKSDFVIFCGICVLSLKCRVLSRFVTGCVECRGGCSCGGRQLVGRLKTPYQQPSPYSQFSLQLRINRPPGLLQRVTVPYAACIQLYPPEDEHLMLETCRGEQYFMNK